MNYEKIISWLLSGDVSIRYQTNRDLLNTEKPALRKKIAAEGWGSRFLSVRHANGHWGRGFYQPKWISTHYTILDLKNLAIHPDNKKIGESVEIILTQEKGPDGGINPSKTIKESDACICGMAMNYSSYFKAEQKHMESVVDFLLSQQMNDGGFNCNFNRKGAVHSSLHTTISVLEGILEYERNGYTYRLEELKRAESESREFILMHKLFRSDRTGEVINQKFLTFYYPGRWFYNILRAMDYFQDAKVKFDERMDDALGVIRERRTKDGLWKLPSGHPGQMHFLMEKTGKPSRWNTLRALRVLRHFEREKTV